MAYIVEKSDIPRIQKYEYEHRRLVQLSHRGCVIFSIGRLIKKLEDESVQVLRQNLVLTFISTDSTETRLGQVTLREIKFLEAIFYYFKIRRLPN